MPLPQARVEEFKTLVRLTQVIIALFFAAVCTLRMHFKCTHWASTNVKGSAARGSNTSLLMQRSRVHNPTVFFVLTFQMPSLNCSCCDTQLIISSFLTKNPSIVHQRWANLLGGQCSTGWARSGWISCPCRRGNPWWWSAGSAPRSCPARSDLCWSVDGSPDGRDPSAEEAQLEKKFRWGAE